jgi:hypothetical protein
MIPRPSNSGPVLAERTSSTSAPRTKSNYGRRMYPRVKKSTAGRAYMALSSKEPFRVFIALSSFKAHFGKADRVLVNLEVAQGLEKSFTALDRGNAVHDADMKVIDPILQDGRNCTDIRVSANISPDLGTRMLAKLGLALGYKLFERPSF